MSPERSDSVLYLQPGDKKVIKAKIVNLQDIPYICLHFKIENIYGEYAENDNFSIKSVLMFYPILTMIGLGSG